MEYIRVTKENIENEHICCAISSNRDIQVISKKNWLKERFDDGLVFLKSIERGKCFIEYIFWMWLSLNLRSVRSIHTLSRQAMYCTTRINVRLMQNMFRCFLKLPGKERFRFRQPDWKRKKKHRMLRHRLQPMHCFIMENTLRMSR